MQLQELDEDPLALSAYQTRAANQPRPDDYQEWVDHEFAKITANVSLQASSTQTFFADWSEYQNVVNASYIYPIAAIRAHNGNRVDNHAKANWSVLSGMSSVKLVFAYVVFIPGQNTAILNGLKSVFGQTCPVKVVPMIDMESGSGFAGGGNHSPEANQLAGMLAAWTGSWDKVYAYANGSDYGSNWPQIDGRLKRHTARYSTTDPSPYGWQYYGGVSTYPSPANYPRTCAPFGSYIDMNVINKPIAQILLDFKVVVPTPPAPTPPPVPEEDEDMKQYTLFQSGPAIYETDGMNYRWVQNPAILTSVQAYLKSRGGDSVVHPTGQAIETYGVPIGPMPAKLSKVIRTEASEGFAPGDYVDGFTVETVDADGNILTYVDVEYGDDI